MAKKLVILCLLAIFIASPVYAGMANDEWSGKDKTLHLGVGAVIGLSVTSFCMLRSKMVWWKAALVGTGAATFVGTVKELMDSSSTGFSYKDLA